MLSQKENFYIEDKGAGYGPYIPEIKSINSGLRTPEYYLSGAKSVIVLGLHFPDACLDIAKITPAETVGPYAFAHYETLFLLRDKAVKIVKYIQQGGYQATISCDLCGLASLVKSSRGMLPDSRANRFAALLSGLGYIGDNGVPLTEKYGTRQRFISIITDYPFSDDPLYSGEILCQKCSHPCIKVCPTKAIKKQKISFTIEGKQFTFPEIDSLHCDWAKRYGLADKEGPAYYGLETETPIPKGRITPQKIAGALTKVRWGVQKRHINICEECIRVCLARNSTF
ncbi:Epoxyqueuosine reductase [subsurface metagenome]